MAEQSTALEQRDQTGALEQRRPDLVVKLDEAMPQLARLGIDADRFARIVLTQCRETPDLLKCTPASFMGAAFASAQLHLEPSKQLGHVWWIPRRNTKIKAHEVQLILGYKGMIELARRVGVIVTVGTVHRNERFEVTGGSNPGIVHEELVENRGEPYAWYAVARFPDGRSIHRVLNREDVEARRARSAAKDSGPWRTDFDAMARKSSVRALWSQLPMVPELQEAARLDEQVLTMPDHGQVRPDLATTAATEDGRQVDPDTGEVPAPASGSSTLQEEPETGSPSSVGPPAPPPPDGPDDDLVDAELVDDTDDEPEEPEVTDPQRRKLFALFGEHGITEDQRVALMRGSYLVDSMNELSDAQTAKLIDVLESEGGPERFKAAADDWLEQDHDSSTGDHGEGSPVEGTTPDEEADTGDGGEDVRTPASTSSPPDPEPEETASERAYRRAAQATPHGQLQARIRRAWGVLSVNDDEAYRASWERVKALLGAHPSVEDWSGASEVELRREAEDLTKRVAHLEQQGQVR